MADQVVDIPGVGHVSFPEGMDDAAITHAIKTNIMPRYAQEGGGVTDAGPPAASTPQPIQSPGPGGVMGAVNTGVNWLGTRATHALTGLASTPRGIADLTKYATNAVGLPPEVATAANAVNPITAVGQFMPSSQDLNRSLFGGPHPVAPEVNLPGPIGKAVDTGTEFALQSATMPGSIVRNAIPAFTGGVTSELGGDATKGTPWEPVARLGGALVGGGGAALAQNAMGSVAQSIRNLMPNVDETAAKIIARNVERDKMTLPALEQAHGELGPGAPLVEAGGPNVRGMVRGSIAAPGEARTTAQETFDARQAQMPDIANAALDTNISPNTSLGTTLQDITALQKQQAAPAYQAAGIPDRPARLPQFAIDEPNPGWNTRIVSTPALEDLYKNSSDIRGAINGVRGLPDYKDLPYNSMSMWDKAYKRLGDMERSARAAEKPSRANDIMNLRKDFQAALTDANPEYQKALDAFSGPQRIKDAAERGKEWFAKDVDPALVTREFQAMTPAEQQAAKEVGVRDWARNIVANRAGRGPGDLAQRTLLDQSKDRARAQAILSPQEFSDFERTMKVVKNSLSTNKDINVGSRTAPMLAEQADNANQLASAGLDVARGRFGSAAMKGVSALGQRVAYGRTEKVNARIAGMMSETDPAKVGLVRSLAEKARLAELTRQSGRRNALAFGGLASPALSVRGRSDR